MDDFFASIPINERKNICVAPISDADFAASGLSILGNASGLFVYETQCDDPCGGIEIIGKLASREVAEKFVAILQAASVAMGINRPVERHMGEAAEIA